MRRTSWTAVCLGAWLACACTDEDSPNNSTSGAALDQVSQATDIGENSDLEMADQDAAQADAAITDAEVGTTAEISDGSAAKPLNCPGGSGCPCSAKTDCDSGYCIENPNAPEGMECAATCNSTCADGYVCAFVAGVDLVSVCVLPTARICNPCAVSADCAVDGLKDSACIDQGPLGKFCGIACSDGMNCPEGYACQDVLDTEGGKSKQCVRIPQAGSQEAFGVCPCNPVAQKQGKSTVCYVESKDQTGAVIGKCAGVRQCKLQGLSSCSSPPPQTEVCNGQDDDCDGKVDESSCDDKNPCTDDTCDGKGGCGHTKLNGTSCDADGSSCTEGDSCNNGKCTAGKDKNCNDSNPCTADTCDLAKGCTQVWDDGKPCDADGSLCTQGDVCQSGACKAGVPVACDDKNPCTKDSCDSKTGQCAAVPVEDGIPCNDLTTCTEKDACKSGTCKGTPISCNDNNNCTSDVCDADKGCQIQKLTGAPCDDGDPCTVGDLCQEGGCEAGKPKACSNPGACAVASCSQVDGKCKVADAADGSVCNDDNACTSIDYCKAGSCTGSAKDCDDGNPCTDDSCALKTGCAHVANNKVCDDDDACTTGDTCKGGNCIGIAKIIKADCDDGNVCTTDDCNAKSGCTHVALANNATCDDDDACTAGETCKAGSCVGGQNQCDCQTDADCQSKEDGNLCNGTLKCDKSSSTFACVVNPKTVIQCDTSADQACLATVCSPSTGACIKVKATDGKLCDADSTACTVDDKCKNGACLQGTALPCDDNNPCTTDSCDTKLGCVNLANTALCDADGDACTLGDTCSGKVCLPGAQKLCDDGEICTQDSCNKATGACTASGGPMDGQSCDADGSVCTAGDLCTSGKCLQGKAKNCDDGNACTDDSCDPKLGCKNTANGKPCDDGNACTANDTCGQGNCVGSAKNPATDCTDGNGCTTEGCDPKSGCVHSANTAQCDDGNVCTVGDTCKDASCKPGTLDKLKCNCLTTADCAALEDGDQCNGTLVCDAQNACVINAKTVIVCSASLTTPCTVASCDPKTGNCSAAPKPDNTPCDADSSVCTALDGCKAGVCKPDTPKVCSDGNVCTSDSCDAKIGCQFANNSGFCTDGNPCTDGDKCSGGSCKGGIPVVCDDSDVCTADVCDTKTGKCVFTFNAASCDKWDAAVWDESSWGI